MEFRKTVAPDGTVTWHRLNQRKLQLDHVQSLMELSEDAAQSLPTEDKRIWFYTRVDKDRRAAGRGNDIFSAEPIILVVERKNFLRDSFEQFRTTTELDLRRELKIHFLNEVCQDAGGLIRDWFSVLTEELFDPKFGLFKRAATSELSYIFNKYSGKLHTNHLEYFYFCGQVVAKALYEAIPIKAYLCRVVFKRMLRRDLTLEDLRYIDPELWSSVSFLRDNIIPSDAFIGNFTVSKKDPTTEKDVTVELKKGGADIPITEANKAEFIRLFFRHVAVTSTEAQFTAFLLGFNSLAKRNIVSILDPDELELFLCGETTIDVQDWKDNTTYGGEFNAEHPVIKNFWTMIEKMSPEELEKLLRFCTGSKRVPAEGFRGLRAANGKLSKFCIEPRTAGDKGMAFMAAHTCFNKVELPIYPDLATMEDTVHKVLDSPSCFQFSFE